MPKQQRIVFLDPRIRDYIMQHGNAEVRYLQAIYDRIGYNPTEDTLQATITEQDGYPLAPEHLREIEMKHLRLIQQYHISRRDQRTKTRDKTTDL